MQHTLNQNAFISGIGLHSGKTIDLFLKPAPPNAGIIFSRTDLGGVSIKACIENIDFNALQMATCLAKDGVIIQTTEHLMSALYAMGVDNAIVEINGPEVPIMDGSSSPFLKLIAEAGLKRQAVSQKILKIKKPFSFEMDGKTLSVEPASEYRISYEIDFDHPLIRRQKKVITVGNELYQSQIAPARTFGFLKDIDQLKNLGLIKGGSLDNAIVLDGDAILNESLRLSDEFVSHKILDLVGDLALSGLRLQGHFQAVKAGHEVHACFLRELLRNENCYEITRTSTTTKRPAFAQQLSGSLVGAV